MRELLIKKRIGQKDSFGKIKKYGIREMILNTYFNLIKIYNFIFYGIQNNAYPALDF